MDSIFGRRRRIVAYQAAVLIVAVATSHTAKAQSEREALAGVWKGTYQCEQGSTAVTITLARPNASGDQHGRFDFGPMPGRRAPSGAYTISVSNDRGAIRLTPLKWLRHPMGYRMVSAKVELRPNRTLLGVIEDPACSRMQLTWNAAPPPPSHAVASPPGADLIASDDTPLAEAIVGKMSVRLLDIDDIGLAVLIASNKPPRVIAMAEWTVDNRAGRADADVTGSLRPERNYLLLALHNKRFAFGTGKWSYDIAVYGDERLLWRGHQTAADPTVGLRFWKLLVIEPAAGSWRIRSADQTELASIRPKVSALNKQLIANYGAEQSVAGLAVGAMVADILSGPSAGSGNNDPAVQFQRRQHMDDAYRRAHGQ